MNPPSSSIIWHNHDGTYGILQNPVIKIPTLFPALPTYHSDPPLVDVPASYSLDYYSDDEVENPSMHEHFE